MDSSAFFSSQKTILNINEDVNTFLLLAHFINKKKKMGKSSRLFVPSLTSFRSIIGRCSVQKVFLEISQKSQENTCAIVCNFIKKEALSQVFCCEFYEIFKNTFSYRTPQRTPYLMEHLCWLLLEFVQTNEFEYQFAKITFRFSNFRFGIFNP